MPPLVDYRTFTSPYKQLDRKFNTWCRYTKRLDTFGRGCLHGCDYCYAKALLDFRGNWLAVPAVARIEKIHAAIKNLARNTVVRLGGMTDCFQPLEQKTRITFETIKLLNRYRINYLIVTKSDLISDNQYMNLYDPTLAHFQISISSTSDNNYEKATPVRKRIQAIETLFREGFDVSIRLSPFLPEKVDYGVLNSIRCNKILVEYLKINHWIKKQFDYDYSEHTVNYGGHYNLPLEKKIEYLKGIKAFEQVSVGEYVPEHYEYFRDNVNYNKQDCCNLDIKQDMKELQLTLFP